MLLPSPAAPLMLYSVHHVCDQLLVYGKPLAAPAALISRRASRALPRSCSAQAAAGHQANEPAYR